jgi:hypothetical protein
VARGSRAKQVDLFMTEPKKRYFKIDIGIDYTVVATSPWHALQIIHECDADFEINLLDYEGLSISEMTPEQVDKASGFDDERNGGLYPLNTFPLGAFLSSEY